MISVRIRGKILNMGELKSGVSQRGKAWKNIQFTIMTNPADAQTDQAVCTARDENAQMLHDTVRLDPYGISVDTYEIVGYLKVDSFPSKTGGLISRNVVECWKAEKSEERWRKVKKGEEGEEVLSGSERSWAVLNGEEGLEGLEVQNAPFGRGSKVQSAPFGRGSRKGEESEESEESEEGGEVLSGLEPFWTVLNGLERETEPNPEKLHT